MGGAMLMNLISYFCPRDKSEDDSSFLPYLSTLPSKYHTRSYLDRFPPMKSTSYLSYL